MNMDTGYWSDRFEMLCSALPLLQPRAENQFEVIEDRSVGMTSQQHVESFVRDSLSSRQSVWGIEIVCDNTTLQYADLESLQDGIWSRSDQCSRATGLLTTALCSP